MLVIHQTWNTYVTTLFPKYMCDSYIGAKTKYVGIKDTAAFQFQIYPTYLRAQSIQGSHVKEKFQDKNM